MKSLCKSKGNERNGLVILCKKYRAHIRYDLNIGLVFFAFTTIIGWNYYGERCMYYLKGLKAVKVYKIIFIACIAIGPFMSLDSIFILADIVNGCMAIPNLIAIIALSGVISLETKKYFEHLKENK